LDQHLQHIIDGCKAYNAKQQEALYMYCYTQMFAVCERYTNNRDNAAAYYNEALLKVLNNINTYENKGEFMGWVRKIMVNTCIDNCRKETKYNNEIVIDHFENNFFVVSNIEEKISSQIVVKLLQTLPKNTSLVFNLYAIEGYKLEEISEKLNITNGTAKWHISEARKILKQKLQQYSPKAIITNE
jgi:RNA polymerase sigma-70 factor, ECF subfamily